YHPVIVDGVQAGDALFRQETFGPIVGLMTYARLAEAIELANAPGYGLSSSIYTNDPREAFQFRRGVSAGMVSVNNSTSGAEAHLPFAGNGKSGNGSRQSGIWVLDQFTRWQSMNWDYAGKLQKAQMDVVELPGQPDFRLEGWRSAADNRGGTDRRPVTTASRLVAGGLIAVAAYLAHTLGVGGHGLDGLFDRWVYTGVELLGVALCLWRGIAVRSDRAGWLLMAAAAAAWTIGDGLWT